MFYNINSVEFSAFGSLCVFVFALSPEQDQCHLKFSLNLFYYPFYIDRILQTVWAEHSTGNGVWPQVLNNAILKVVNLIKVTCLNFNSRYN